jgi:hypothetical protein
VLTLSLLREHSPDIWHTSADGAHNIFHPRVWVYDTFDLLESERYIAFSDISTESISL